MNPQPTIDAMEAAAHALRTGDARERARAIQTAQDALDAAKAVALNEIDEAKSYEVDGASTLNMWVRNELNLAAGRATALVRSSRVMRDLDLVSEAAIAGLLSAEHLKVFVYGLKHLGHDLMRMHEEVLVAVAVEHDPGRLFETVKHLKDVTHPEDLDEKWRDGMEKQDFAVDALPDGWHVTGFLNTVTGAKLKAVLDSVSAPRDKEDLRTGPERRVQGLDDLLSSILANGMPDDKGVKPHLSVFVDADTLAAAAEHVHQSAEDPFGAAAPMPPVRPAKLAGFGNIAPHLLMYLFCVSDFTAFLMKADGGMRQAQVLNAGRGKYRPNLKQRRSVIARQEGVCATPGCRHTHLEIHHVIWWSLGGRTDLDELIGLCSRCHHLLHRGLVNITGNATDGFTFTNRVGDPLRRRRRSHYRRAA